MNDLNNAIGLILEKLESWGQHLVLMLPNIFVALVLLIITFIVANLVRKGVTNVLGRFSHSPAISNLVTTLVYIAIVIVGCFFVLSVLQLDKVVVSLLAGVGIIGLALGFAFQDIAANFIYGVIISNQKPFGVGCLI